MISAAREDDGAVGVEHELRVVERSVIALVDADGDYCARPAGGLPYGFRREARNLDGLLDE